MLVTREADYVLGLSDVGFSPHTKSSSIIFTVSRKLDKSLAYIESS